MSAPMSETEKDCVMLLVWEAWAKQHGEDDGAVFFRHCADRMAKLQKRGDVWHDEHWRVLRLLTAEIDAIRADSAPKRLDTACANVLLAFQDWPAYESASANAERTSALNALADAVADVRRASPGPETPHEE